MTTTNTANFEGDPFRETARRLKAKRDAYTQAGFTLEEAMRLLEAELSRPPEDTTPRQLRPAPLEMPAWPHEPYRPTCELTEIVDALVVHAGGYHEDGVGRLTVGGVFVRSA